MRELGRGLGAPSTTRSAGSPLRLDVDRLVAVGEGARPVHLGAAHEGSWGDEAAWVPDIDAALELLRGQVRPGDVVLSRRRGRPAWSGVADALRRGRWPA